MNIKPIIFDGVSQALTHETALSRAIRAWGKPIRVAAVLFTEDSGSRLYTGLKHDAAQRVGIAYQVDEFSILDPVATVRERIQHLNADAAVTGIIIQKPTRKLWQSLQARATNTTFDDWWQALVTTITPPKDVDGLHPETLAAVKAGTWKKQGMVLPATCQAVLEIIDLAADQLHTSGSHQLEKGKDKVLIIGKSDLLGNPLYYELKNRNWPVELLTRKKFRERITAGTALTDGKIIVSATGQPKLITGDMLATDTIIIDVGEPQGDVDMASVIPTAAFITPVPGGVGPMTVICLMQNALRLAQATE